MSGMLLPIPDVLTKAQVARARELFEQADWVDGRATAGHQSALAKQNRQLREDDPAARELGEMIVGALGAHPLFLAAALPARVFPPLFNRYEGGESFGTHIDNAIRQVSGTPLRVRTDLSATLFFSGPDDYDGGELVIEEYSGTHQIKLPAGHLILYPAWSRHHVRPVTRGARLASFFWIQSMVRDEGRRRILFDLDLAIQDVNRERAGSAAAISLTGVYHNLLRRWAEV
jgi:PKHD-type hydroxylase